MGLGLPGETGQSAKEPNQALVILVCRCVFQSEGWSITPSFLVIVNMKGYQTGRFEGWLAIHFRESASQWAVFQIRISHGCVCFFCLVAALSNLCLFFQLYGLPLGSCKSVLCRLCQLGVTQGFMTSNITQPCLSCECWLWLATSKLRAIREGPSATCGRATVRMNIGIPMVVIFDAINCDPCRMPLGIARNIAGASHGSFRTSQSQDIDTM